MKMNVKHSQEDKLWQELEAKEQEQIIGGTYVGSANLQSSVMAYVGGVAKAYVGGVQAYVGGATVGILQHFVGGVN